MSDTFMIPLPANYSTDELDYSDAELDKITKSIKVAWGREPLPKGGGFDMVLHVPGNNEVPKEVGKSIAGFFALILKDIGVLSERPAYVSINAEGGAATAEAVITMGMLRKPDGTLFE